MDNPGDGKTLSLAAGENAFTLIDVEAGGRTLAFKDMNGNGPLDTWEDWRLTDSTVRNLAWLIQSGMYENPYVDLEDSKASVGDAKKTNA
ncbi:Uncharacterised protein [Actinomyces bovis]|uniref:Uncharacterized protein n=1 Tax=Actinomyces bovis TaxID=1658 RepID=A0ABY1VM73_9ACTO|nr:hypothetical protein [Actinomyces bovis]SPT53190.1 Uncharacterised protein [Actinomyces bovis]VEG52407.1 Uncharacterised protein [Actinomyces israelii]